MVRILILLLIPVVSFSQCVCEDVCSTRIIVEWGQSNGGAKCGDDFTLDLPDEGNVQIYSNVTNSLQPMEFGVNTGNPSNPDHYSIGTLTGAYQEYDYVFKFSVGGTSIAQSDGLDFNIDSGEYYNQILSNWDDFVSQVECENIVVDGKWVHGEKDSTVEEWANEYQANFENIINGFDDHIGVNVSWDVYELNSFIAPLYPYYQKINDAFIVVSNAYSTVNYVSTQSVTYCDNVHIDAQSIIDLSQSQ